MFFCWGGLLDVLVAGPDGVTRVVEVAQCDAVLVVVLCRSVIASQNPASKADLSE
jgi:hypothetical protein